MLVKVRSSLSLLVHQLVLLLVDFGLRKRRSHTTDKGMRGRRGRAGRGSEKRGEMRVADVGTEGKRTSMGEGETAAVEERERCFWVDGDTRESGKEIERRGRGPRKSDVHRQRVGRGCDGLASAPYSRRIQRRGSTNLLLVKPLLTGNANEGSACLLLSDTRARKRMAHLC
jgi:hypothetical protein